LSQQGAAQDALYDDLAAQQVATQTRVKAAVDLLASKTTEVARLSEAAAEAKANLRLEKKQRSSLVARIHDLEHDLQAASDEAARYRATAEDAEQKLRKISQSA